jgi:hypothetical protein
MINFLISQNYLVEQDKQIINILGENFMNDNIADRSENHYPDSVEIDNLNLANLDVEELEHRLELAAVIEPGCGVNWRT